MYVSRIQILNPVLQVADQCTWPEIEGWNMVCSRIFVTFRAYFDDYLMLHTIVTLQSLTWLLLEVATINQTLPV